MPKHIDRYIIQRTQPTIIDQIEHYEAKQKTTNFDFVLKRVKTLNSINTSTTSFHSISHYQSGTFQQLTNETLILKLLDNASIPKCLRILKTCNNIYFVYENYPFTSLEQFRQKNELNFETKIQISIKIITVVNYIHKHNIVYRGINEQNIKIDDQLNVYMTNFMQARSFENIDQKLKSLNQAKKQRQFRSLINEDLYDLAKLFLKIFDLDKINNESQIFLKQKQRNLYDVLSPVSQKKIKFITLQNLVKILTQKETEKTKACTSTTSSFHSIGTNDLRKIKKLNISRQIVPAKNFSKSFSSINLTLRNSKNKENNSTYLHNTRHIQVNKNQENLHSKTSNLLRSQRLGWSDQLNSVVQKIAKEKQKERQNIRKQISSIISTRKIINLILNCMKSIKKQYGMSLIYMLAIKCEFLSMKKQTQIQRCLLQPIDNDQKEALKFIKKQNIKTIITLQIIKQSMKQLFTKYPSFQEDKQSDLLQFLKNQKISQQNLQQKLSIEIYSYLKKQTQTIFENYKGLTQEYTKKLNLHQNGQEIYEKFRQFYYLSIKLKYKSFEEFFEKKDNFQTENFSILKDEYFMYFESRKIPLDKIINQVLFRLDTFRKN